MLDYSKVRFLWRGDAGRKVSSGRYDKIYDMGPRAATGDATFATAATRPIVDELSDWYGLAVEPAATNLALRSEEFDDPYWDKNNLSATPNTTIAPEGNTTADTLTSTDTSVALCSRAITIIANTIYTTTFFVKQGTQRYVYIRFRSLSLSGYYVSQVFDLQDLVVGESSVGSVSGILVGATIQSAANGFVRISLTASINEINGSFGIGFATALTGNTISGAGTITSTVVSGNTFFLWGAQVETGSVATQYKPTTSGTTTYSAVVAPIPDAIPVTGTIIMWDNMVNAYPGTDRNRVMGSEDLSTTYLVLSKDYTNPNQLVFYGHNNTPLNSSDLNWHPTNQRKRWFFAMTYDGTNVDVYRGDVQGNIEKVIDTTYTPTTAAIRDMYLNSNSGAVGQVGASFLDILTYDDVLTQADIEAIFYGEIPIFQQTAYAGTFVDKFRQKVQAETGSTYVTTLEATVLADWSEDIFGAYDPDASAFFSRGFDDGATIENIDFANTQILALKALA